SASRSAPTSTTLKGRQDRGTTRRFSISSSTTCAKQWHANEGRHGDDRSKPRDAAPKPSQRDRDPPAFGRCPIGRYAPRGPCPWGPSAPRLGQVEAMTRYEYRLVDVFTDRAFGGNPLAVFREPGGLDAKTMQAIAKELHLSETTFVLKPSSAAADHRVRMFTPDTELPFAGHPTLGTAYVLADGKDGATRLE